MTRGSHGVRSVLTSHLHSLDHRTRGKAVCGYTRVPAKESKIAVTSPLVTRLLKSNRSVVQHIETNAEKLATRLGERLAPHLERGERMPDLALTMRLLGRYLARHAEALGEADDANEAEKRDDPALAQSLDQSSAELYAATTRTREILAGVFTASALARFGFVGDTPQPTDTLLRFVAQVTGALRELKPTTSEEGVTVDVKRLVRRLDALREKTAALSADMLRERRELQVTQAARRSAIDAGVSAFSAVAGAFSALLLLAGEEELAARTRPSRARPGVTDEEDAEPTPPEPAPST